MTFEEIEARIAEIRVESEAEDADIEALNAEVDSLLEQKSALEKAAAEKRALLDKVASAVITPIEKAEERKQKMSDIEIRNTPAYIEAYANYVKTGKDAECRALLTENGSGTVPVPEFVYEEVKHAWEREGIMALVRKSYLKGNLKVGFEISGDAAVIHTEGGVAINPEDLVLGVINMVPVSIKKVVQISDEVYDMRGEDFLRYIYAELTYRIAKKAADTLISKIIACGTESTTTQVGVPVMTASNVYLGQIAQAMALLSDEAVNPVVVMNKITWGVFKKAQADGNFGYDPFEGLPVVFNNTITPFSAATTGVTFALVGDFDQGALANFPNGDGIDLKFDDMTLKKQDLIEVLGRQYVAVEPVAPNAFVKITKAAAAA